MLSGPNKFGKPNLLGPDNTWACVKIEITCVSGAHMLFQGASSRNYLNLPNSCLNAHK